MPRDALGEGRCRSCGRRILWAKTTGGKYMPLDPSPSSKGNVTLDHGVARVDTNARGDRWVSHFATCPQQQLFQRELRQAREVIGHG